MQVQIPAFQRLSMVWAQVEAFTFTVGPSELMELVDKFYELNL